MENKKLKIQFNEIQSLQIPNKDEYIVYADVKLTSYINDKESYVQDNCIVTIDYNMKESLRISRNSLRDMDTIFTDEQINIPFTNEDVEDLFNSNKDFKTAFDHTVIHLIKRK